MKIRAISLDDDPTATLMVRQLAKKVDYLELVKTYSNPIEGAAGIILDRPDLLFLDIEMPECTGLELMAALVNPPKIIVISSSEEHRNAVMEMNAVAFLRKPPRKEDFVSAVDKAYDLINLERNSEFGLAAT